MTPAIASGPQANDFVTATGTVRSDDLLAPGATVSTIERGDLGEISGGIVDGTAPFPLPRPDGLPVPGPFYPAPPRPDLV